MLYWLINSSHPNQSIQETAEILEKLKTGEEKRLEEARALQEKMEREKKALQAGSD